MELHQAIYERRSIRDYRDEPVAAGVIEGLIGDAVQAPNSMDRQAWSFTVVRGRERLAGYSREALAHMAQANTMPGLLAANPGFNIFYNAPALIVISATMSD